MKYLTILPFLFVGALKAQTDFKSLQQFDTKSLDFKMDFSSSNYSESFKILMPSQSIIDEQTFQSDLKLFSPQQYNLSNYPMDDLSNMDDLIMGTSLSSELQMGRKKIQTIYLFDVNGNFKSSQTSFSLSKNKK